MYKISQSGHEIERRKNIISDGQIPMNYRINKPECENRPEHVSFHRMARKYDHKEVIQVKIQSKSESIDSQYISYKLKPLIKSTSRASPEQQYNYSALSRQKIIKSPQGDRKRQNTDQVSGVSSKSPEFFYQNSEHSSIKGSFAEQQSLNPFKENPYLKKHFKKSLQQAKNESSSSFHSNLGKSCSQKSKQINLQNKSKTLENIKPINKLTLNDSVVDDDFDEFKIFTPCKNLRDQFLRQEKLYQERSKGRELKQFDSFNQFNQGKEQINCKSFQKQQPQAFQKKNTSRESNAKNGFFFLTNPSWTSEKKRIADMTPQKEHFQGQAANYLIHKAPFQEKKNEVKQFCFSLSSIQPSMKSEKVNYCQKNLFSNSDDNLALFDSKNFWNASSQAGSKMSKKFHIKQLVEEFVEQLEHLDQGSLNCKVVNDLEEVLESIVFKQTNDGYPEVNYYNKLNFGGENKTEYGEKRQKRQLQNCHNYVLTERKTARILNNQNYSYLGPKSYMMKTVSSQNKFFDKKSERSASSEHKSTTRRQDNSKQQKNKGQLENRSSVYKPNFGINQGIKQKQNQKECNTFSHLKSKPSCSALNINPKSSIYFNKGSKANRSVQKVSHRKMKTEYNYEKIGRIY